MPEFVHLHVHTQYSLLDGFSHIPKLVGRAKEMGMPALGITDHGTMFGVIDFFREAKSNGIKPIIGVEAYLAHKSMAEKHPLDRKSTHLLLLAENMTGYKNLLKISSAAQLEGFYYYPRIDHEFLAAHSEGLICTSGCMSAEIPRALLQDNPEEARRKLDWYYEVFGPDRFFIELQSHDIPELPILNRQLIELGKRYQGRYVATNDVHYVNPEDAKWQDIMLCVQTGSLLSDPNRMQMTDESFYLKSAQEMAALFQDVPNALSNSLLIAERCNVDLSTDGYVLPEFEVPEGYTVKSYLRKLCTDGIYKRYGDHAEDPEVQERLEYELGVIDEMGFNAYFLIVWDLCRFSREEDIWYNARGSAAGSIVAYALEISLIDPLEHGLIFERFLNPGRVSMPDIDLDFQDDKRYLLMEYCAKKYGEDRVASIITFGKLKARAAVRDVGRVLDIPLSEVDRIAKMIPALPLNTTISDAMENVPDLKREYETIDWVKELLDTAKEIEGSLRNAGTHAAGVVITDKPVVEYIPLHRPTGQSEDTPIQAVTQFEMSTIDSLGLLKVDFLGLASLTIMQRCCEMIKERHGIELNLDNIPLDDPEVYQMLGEGNTAGVFQLEGTGMTRWVKEMKPKSLSHVIAMVALYRPGPMDFIPSYIKRMHGEEQVSYSHEKLEDILSETYGITVYQEQIMYTAMELGGYTASEADFLRKAVAKKKESELLKNREKFIAGAVNNSIPESTAVEIFDNWENFARYGFPKGHAADYAVLAVETAYLKQHYPVEYMTALVSVYQHDTDKVAYYVADCHNQGIEVLPPNINRSCWDFSIEDGEDGKACIRFGMGAVKNVGTGPVNEIMEGREDGPFDDLTDLANRVDLRKVGKRAMESLIKVGALDSFGPRMALLEVMERAISISASKFQAEEIGQMSFFGNENGLVQKIRLPNIDPNYNRKEQLNWERDLVGLYVSDHPLRETAQALEGVITHYASQLAQAEQHAFVRVFGEVVRISKTFTKKGDEMAFVRLEDISGSNKLVIFPKTWKRVAGRLNYGKVVIAEGKVDNQKGEPSILVDDIKSELQLDSEQLERMRKSAQESTVKNHTAQPKPAVQNAAPGLAPNHQISESERQLVKKADPQTDFAKNNAISNDYIPPQPDLPSSYNIWNGSDQDLEYFEEYQAQKTEPEVPAKTMAEPSKDYEPEPAVGDAELEPFAAKNSESVTEEKSAEEDAKQVAPLQSPATAETNPQPEISTGDPAPIVPPVAPAEQTPDRGKKVNPRMVTVVLRTLGDKERDILRMRRIYGMLISEPGNDRFAFYVIEHNRGYRLEFPSDSTALTKQLQSRLEDLVGLENVIVEPITIQ